MMQWTSNSQASGLYRIVTRRVGSPQSLWHRKAEQG